MITVGNLADKITSHEFTLIAGENGLNNVVNWVHMMEGEELSSFLNGGEIVIITGIGLQNEDNLFSLIKGIVRYGASAAVIHIGPYIKKINQECINFCNEMEIPLFTMPWRIHIVDITYLFCNIIIESEKSNMDISAVIQNAIFLPERTDLYLTNLEKYGLRSNWRYCVVLMELSRYDINEDDKYLSKLQKKISAYFIKNSINALCFKMNEEIILLFYDLIEIMVDEIMEKLERYCKDNGFIKYINIGIGKVTMSIRCIYKSYGQAEKVVVLKKKNCISKINKYKDIGVYKVLFDLHDRNVIFEYIDETIGKVMEYDSYNNTNLSAVLKCYLDFNGSVQDTANSLYIHRNTVNYKIKKVEEILGVDLSNLKVREVIDIAYKLKDTL